MIIQLRLATHQYIPTFYKSQVHKTSDIVQICGKDSFLGEDGEAFQERIESLSSPGAKETEEAHAGLTALWTPRPPTDLARNDQRAYTTFRQVILSGNTDSVHNVVQLNVTERNVFEIEQFVSKQYE